ncbi:MAG TPA: NAD(P)-dependent oxidoreductase [Patescibacteria group bacterium]|nr:NAD(P)-dependent oxidoreductase [Patescibacteria group bacterium]
MGIAIGYTYRMKVLITGGGVVGTYAAKEAEGRGFTPRIFELKPDEDSIKSVWETEDIVIGDISKKEDIEKVIEDFGPDVIVHTAALRQRMAMVDPDRARLVNVEGTRNVVEIASSKNVPLVHISSDTIYGTSLDDTITEDTPLDPKTIYAETKVEAEKIVQDYDKAIILRSTSLYAPWKGAASTFNEIVRSIIYAGIEGKDFEMAVPVAERSEQLYVKDLASAILNAATAQNLQHKVFNVGAGRLVSYGEIADAARELFGIKVTLTDADFGKERVQSVRAVPLDITRAKEELNYNPAFTFDKAFKYYTNTIKSWNQ